MDRLVSLDFDHFDLTLTFGDDDGITGIVQTDSENVFSKVILGNQSQQLIDFLRIEGNILWKLSGTIDNFSL